MRKKINLIKKKAGVSAVIGVILMVALTIAIAATVYVYVSNTIEKTIQENTNSVTVTGKLIGMSSTNDMFYLYDYTIKIGNLTYKNVYLNTEINYYLFGLLGQNITLVLSQHQHCNCINDYNCTITYTYEYIDAYIN